MALGILGIAVLAVTMFDFLQTTIGASRAGPLSGSIARLVWRALVALSGRTPAAWTHRVCGPLVLSAVAVGWILATSVAWLAILEADPNALVLRQSGDPVGWLQTYAYVGSALSTMGDSNASAANTFWDVVTVVAAVNGMMLLTLSVTFVLNITQAVADGRTFAMLSRSVDPADPANVQLLLPALAHLASQLNAFPFALYYSSPRSERRIVAGIADFAEKLSAAPELLETYRLSLSALPGVGIEASDAAPTVANRVRSWSERYRLSHSSARGR